MTFELLSPDRIAVLNAQALTYPDVGATSGALPDGYHRFAVSRQLPTGVDFAAAAHDLMTWQVQRRSGLRVAASSADVAPGVVAILRLGVGRLSLTIPCRVVYTVDEPNRRGFAYGTLPGHPESGEEAFVVSRNAHGRVVFTVMAFSRPGTVLARFAGPLGRQFQHLMTHRYLRTLE